VDLKRFSSTIGNAPCYAAALPQALLLFTEDEYDYGMPHIDLLTIHQEHFPVIECYPFTLPVLQGTTELDLSTPVTLFVGENGSGKSTVLEAIARRCRVPIWDSDDRARVNYNPHEHQLHRYIDVRWVDGAVPGSYFSAQIFRTFAVLLDEFASADPGQLKYFGGNSLMALSHGQSLMSFFEARYKIRGLYLLDEPETALSPKSQVALVRLVHTMAAAGHAQFLICTHSPILLACPEARIYSFDSVPVAPIAYEDTEHYRVYKAFLEEPGRWVGNG